MAEMSLHCCLADSPVAHDADQLYLRDDDNGNLWNRSDHSIPLPTCSSPNALDSQSHVCTRDNKVYVLCRHLCDKLVMEALGGKPITLREIDCSSLSPEQQLNFSTDSVSSDSVPTTTIIIAVLFVLAVLVVAGVVLYRRHRKRGKKHEIVRRDAETETKTAMGAAQGDEDVEN